VTRQGELRALGCVVGVVSGLTGAGCGSSGAPGPPSAAERYVTVRIGQEIRSAGPMVRRAAGAQPDIFVYCRLSRGGISLCQGSISSSSTHEVVANQRWQVQLAPSGSVLSARALDGRLVPAGSLAARLLALRARQHPDSPRARAMRRPATLSLEGAAAPLDPTYVCVDNGHGKVLFQGVLRAPRLVRVRARHLRLNLGNSNVTVHVNGKIFRIPASPYGLSIFRDHVAYLPKGERPCP
jgi:hypothetical protein